MRLSSLFLLILLIVTPAAMALDNSVVVESKTFYAGQAGCSVGVFVSNDVPITGAAIPLEFRELAPGAYPGSGFQALLNEAGRLYVIWNTCVGDFYPPLFWPIRYYAEPSATECSGPSSHTWAATAPTMDYLSPDAVLIAVISCGDADQDYFLDPGSDLAGTSNASAIFRFNASVTPGQFEIDTCCVRPASHLQFVDWNTQVVIPSFTKGTITIECACPHAGDPNGDGTIIDIADVIETVNVAFRGQPATQDPHCPYSQTDVNCDGRTDIVDAVRVSLVTFAGYDAGEFVCRPCQ